MRVRVSVCVCMKLERRAHTHTQRAPWPLFSDDPKLETL